MHFALQLSLVAGLLAATATSACASLEPYDPNLEGAAQYTLSSALRPGAGFLCSDLELHFIYYGVGDELHAEVSSDRQTDGSLFVFVSGSHTIKVAPKEGKTAYFRCAGWVDAAGRSHGIALPQEYKANSIVAPRVLSFVNGTLVANPVGGADGTKGYWWPAGSPAVNEIDISALQGSVGLRADRSGLVTVAYGPDASQMSFRSWRVDATPALVVDGADVPFTPPEGSIIATVRFADEVAPGVFALVSESAGNLQYFRTDRPDVVSAIVPDSSAMRFSRNADTGHVQIVGTTVHDWDADGTGTLVSPPLPSLSEGYVPWTLSSNGAAVSELSQPNANAENLRIPLSYEVAFVENAGFVGREAPSTPCADRNTCRAVGEHYLIGALKSGSQRYGVYYSWPWLQDFVRPLIVFAPLP